MNLTSAIRKLSSIRISAFASWLLTAKTAAVLKNCRKKQLRNGGKKDALKKKLLGSDEDSVADLNKIARTFEKVSCDVFQNVRPILRLQRRTTLNSNAFALVNTSTAEFFTFVERTLRFGKHHVTWMLSVNRRCTPALDAVARNTKLTRAGIRLRILLLKHSRPQGKTLQSNGKRLFGSVVF